MDVIYEFFGGRGVAGIDALLRCHVSVGNSFVEEYFFVEGDFNGAMIGVKGALLEGVVDGSWIHCF